jgi:hypothetical protein
MTVKRILIGNDHDDSKWVVLSALADGAPACCEVRRSINTAALVDGTESLATHKAELEIVAEEYHARWLAIQAEIDAL